MKRKLNLSALFVTLSLVSLAVTPIIYAACCGKIQRGRSTECPNYNCKWGRSDDKCNDDSECCPGKKCSPWGLCESCS